MTRPKFKSDARPSDTKSVVLHRENDRRLLDHLARVKRESAFWRAAGYFYLDFMAWLATQGADAPPPGQEFIHYQHWLERDVKTQDFASIPYASSSSGGQGGPAAIDPESISAAILPGVRAVVEAALSTHLAGLALTAGAPDPVQELELVEMFSAELVLE